MFSAEQVFAMLLSELKKTTEQTLGTKIHDCVISVGVKVISSLLAALFYKKLHFQFLLEMLLSFRSMGT